MVKERVDLRKLKRKPIAELRKERIEVLFNEKERLELLEKARNERMTLSNYIRWKSLRNC